MGVFDERDYPVMRSLSHVIIDHPNWRKQRMKYMSRVSNYCSKQFIRSILAKLSHRGLPLRQKTPFDQSIKYRLKTLLPAFITHTPPNGTGIGKS